MDMFNRNSRRISGYRACLQRDVERGLIPRETYGDVDACYSRLLAMIEFARVQLEGGGVGIPARFSRHFVSACAGLAGSMFGSMYRERRVGPLRHRARNVVRQADRLMEHFRARSSVAA